MKGMAESGVVAAKAGVAMFGRVFETGRMSLRDCLVESLMVSFLGGGLLGRWRGKEGCGLPRKNG